MARISVVEDAIARLRSSGAGTVVVKTAGQGAVAAQAGQTVAVAGIPTQVVDSTGAGDSFDAGFLAGFLGGQPLRRCLEIGNACGALSTRGIGGASTQPTMVEALETIERGSVP
jgi:sugar/nucleoside kinase (ribokinase family)